MSNNPIKPTGSSTNIRNLIDAAQQVVILTSERVDPDNIAAGRLMGEIFSTLGKSFDYVSFYKSQEQLEGFPATELYQDVDMQDFDFSKYDLIVLVDGADWVQFISNDLIEKVKSKVILVDHHHGEIAEQIPERVLVRAASCAAEIVIEDLFPEFGIELTDELADLAYNAMISDTARFSWEVNSRTYRFAAKLMEFEVDHYRSVELEVPDKQMEFMAWAMTQMENFPELRLQMLIITEEREAELQKLFGENWNMHSKYFKFSVFRRQKGYDYGIVLRNRSDGQIDLSWRTRNFGSTLAIRDVAEVAGFNAGGHRNAGGGVYAGTLESAKQEITQAIQLALSKLN